LKDLRSAHAIRIIAAYFLPARPIRRELIRAARRGKRVQIILGARSDVPLLQLPFRRFYKAFLKSGVEIYAYQPQIVQAKLIIAACVVYAGSENLDRRSFLANYELMLRITQNDVTAEAGQIFEAMLGRCRPVDAATWNASRNFWCKLKEWWAFF